MSRQPSAAASAARNAPHAGWQGWLGWWRADTTAGELPCTTS